MKREHWARFLPEAGSVNHWAQDQESRRAKAKLLRAEARQIDKEYEAEERGIMAAVLRNWTPEEIETAIRDALEFRTKANKRRYLDQAYAKH